MFTRALVVAVTVYLITNSTKISIELCVQALWVWLTLSPVLIINITPSPAPLMWTDAFGEQLPAVGEKLSLSNHFGEQLPAVGRINHVAITLVSSCLQWARTSQFTIT